IWKHYRYLGETMPPDEVPPTPTQKSLFQQMKEKINRLI
ncbi:MAG TPA: methionine synthase, partial [Cyanobacteria bacterium UBA11166]|nr:methionine synthase [Cyanobacteria bacterium UBA11166]